eukprot:GHVL01003544.1.p1 GENE.GHVL01003544.1~~GHVL01003544.1.p1  ORF type:complete len:265 (-),score=0.48 GHVL01003544.1:187-981(-)
MRFNSQSIFLTAAVAAFICSLVTIMSYDIHGIRSQIYSDWGFYMLPVGLLLWIVIGSDASSENIHESLRFLLWSMLPASILHFFEEFGFDLKGGHSTFANWANNALFSCSHSCPLDSEVLFWISAFTVGINYTLSLATMAYFPAAACVNAFVMLIVGASHIAFAFMDVAYHPGLATALVFLLPIGLLAVFRLSERNRSGVALMSYAAVALLYCIMSYGVLSMWEEGNISKAGLWYVLFVINLGPTLFGMTVSALDCNEYRPIVS